MYLQSHIDCVVFCYPWMILPPQLSLIRMLNRGEYNYIDIYARSAITLIKPQLNTCSNWIFTCTFTEFVALPFLVKIIYCIEEMIPYRAPSFIDGDVWGSSRSNSRILIKAGRFQMEVYFFVKWYWSADWIHRLSFWSTIESSER